MACMQCEGVQQPLAGGGKGVLLNEHNCALQAFSHLPRPANKVSLELAHCVYLCLTTLWKAGRKISSRDESN